MRIEGISWRLTFGSELLHFQVEKDLFLIKFMFQSMKQTQENLEQLATNATMTRTKWLCLQITCFFHVSGTGSTKFCGDLEACGPGSEEP